MGAVRGKCRVAVARLGKGRSDVEGAREHVSSSAFMWGLGRGSEGALICDQDDGHVTPSGLVLSGRCHCRGDLPHMTQKATVCTGPQVRT